MLKKSFVFVAALAASCAAGAAVAQESVKVTPLGSHDGEFCPFDRAMIFEDPNGTRILYDAGRTVAGGDDPRLGDIDIIFVSHMHGDHVGDKHIAEPGAGECGSPDLSVDATPASNTVGIALEKDATIVTGSEMPPFFARKLEAGGGDPEKSVLVRFGASRVINDIAITTVPAVHSNGLNPAFIDGEIGEHMKAAGLNAYVGPPTGYVVTFSNGLAVYLSGDTGITAEQELVVRGHYGAKLAVINIGDVYTTGPDEATYVINELVQPASVIPSHANEVATEGGKVIEGTRTASFIESVNMPAYLPISGLTRTFDADGKCVDGCE